MRISANDSSLPTHEECALAVFSFDTNERLALLRHLSEDHLSDRAELELGRILAFYVTGAPRRLQVGLRDFRAWASFPLPLALDEQQRTLRGDFPQDHWSLHAGGGDRDAEVATALVALLPLLAVALTLLTLATLLVKNSLAASLPTGFEFPR